MKETTKAIYKLKGAKEANSQGLDKYFSMDYLKKEVKRNKGTATIEYILLLCVIALALLYASDLITRKIGGEHGIKDLPAKAVESIEKLFNDIKSEGIDYSY